MDLSMTIGMQQLQVVARLLATSIAPHPMVDVPGLFFGAKDLPAHHAPPLLFLPEILEPASTRGVANLPGGSTGQTEASVPIGLPSPTLFQGLQGHDALGIVAIPAHPHPLDPKGGRLAHRLRRAAADLP